MSLYEDLVAAWVPAKHDWLRKRPLGEELVNKLGSRRMFSYCACMSSLIALFYSVSISSQIYLSVPKLDLHIFFIYR